MGMRVKWMEILMIIGTALGGLLTAVLFMITRNDASLWLLVIGLVGGAFLGLYIDKVISKEDY